MTKKIPIAGRIRLVISVAECHLNLDSLGRSIGNKQKKLMQNNIVL